MATYNAEITQKFLDEYKTFEYIEENDPHRFEIIKKQHYVEFNALRHIRNCLTHTPKVNGDFPFHVADYVLETLEEIINKLVVKAYDVGVKKDKIKTLSPDTDVLHAMRYMDHHHITNVPIFDEKGCVRYVVSTRTIFSILANAEYDENRSYTIEDLKDKFDINNSKDLYYLFLAKDTFAFDAKQYFIGYNKEHKRCALIFITEHGLRNEPVLGIVSPGDVFNI